MPTQSINEALEALATEKANLEKVQIAWETALSIALAVTAVAALMIFVFDFRVRRTSKRIQEVQDEIIRNKDAEATRRQTELEIEQRKTAEAQKAAAEAQLELKKYVNLIATAQGPRGINDGKFLSALRKGQTGTIEISYQGGASETFLFASAILALFRRAGWIVPQVSPSPIDSMVGVGGVGTGLNEIVLLMKHPGGFLNDSSIEGAAWMLYFPSIVELGRYRTIRYRKATLR